MKKRRLTRDALIFGLGLLMLISQTTLTFVGRNPNETVLTVGAGLLFAPAALRRDEKRGDG